MTAKKANLVEFFLSSIWRENAKLTLMLRVKKIMRENAFEQKKKNLAKLTFNQKTIEKHL